MDVDKLDDYLREQISSNVEICEATVIALREGKIDKEYALEVLSKAKSAALRSFDQRCLLFETNGLDYKNIESKRNDFSNSLDDAVYKIVNPKDYNVEAEETIGNLLR